MSINIPNRIVNISDPIYVTVQFNKLGPVQQKALIRGIETRTFTKSGVPFWVAKSVMNSVFGKDKASWLRMDGWRMWGKNITVEDREAIAKAMEEVLLVGGLDDSSIEWSEAQRDRRSWRRTEVVTTGFESMQKAINDMRSGMFSVGENYLYMSDMMSEYMQKHMRKLLLDTRKNVSILPLIPEYVDLADRIRRGEISNFTCRADQL